MNNLSRKLLTSVLTLAFAFITLGATTFAWFTLQSSAAIDSFEANMVAGVGIEISLDGTSWKNYVDNAELQKFIGDDITFDLLTTSDGINFKKFNSNDGKPVPIVSADKSRYVEFTVFFRSPQVVPVHLSNQTKVDPGEGKLWVSDAEFPYRGGLDVSVSDSITVYLADTIRMSFSSLGVEIADGKVSKTGEEESATVLELDPVGRTGKNIRLDTSVNEWGMIPYYNYKKPTQQLNTDLFEKVVAGVKNNTNYKEQPIITLEQQVGEYYYGAVVVRVWAEGWDPDAFNAIMGGSVKVGFGFEAGEPQVDPEG